MPSEHYAAFIEEAFVKPIRSVLIVDDDYPTFDEILDRQIQHKADQEFREAKEWYNNPARIKKVIESFRAPPRPLLVDIHDGSNVDAGAEVLVASHLHQSDLLVLDYQLDRTKTGDGSLAIKIIRSLASNNHFNLVVVNTNETIDTVFQSIVISLLSAGPEILSDEEEAKAKDLVEAEELNTDGFSDTIFNSINIDQYLFYRLRPDGYIRSIGKGEQPFSSYKAASPTTWNIDQLRLVAKYLLNRVQRDYKDKFGPNSAPSVEWSSGSVKWIRTDSIFVAFSPKEKGADLLEELQLALNAWKPEPSRLFLAKLRAEMDEYGVMAQEPALGHRHARAHWYDRLISAGGPERKSLIAESVSRHSDRLLSEILPRVEAFATGLVENDAATGSANDLCKGHFNVDLNKAEVRLRAEQEHNAFVCSKPPEGWHLTTGHIFTLKDEFWACLSPACDTVPSQLSDALVASFGERLPFIAVKLHPISDTKTPEDIQLNRFVFLELDKVIKGFSFNPGSATTAPTWHRMFADKRGKFLPDFHLDILNTEISSRGLTYKKHRAVVVSQLRYEYALNLIHRLGTSFTRVGLDFVAPLPAQK